MTKAAFWTKAQSLVLLIIFRCDQGYQASNHPQILTFQLAWTTVSATSPSLHTNTFSGKNIFRDCQTEHMYKVRVLQKIWFYELLFQRYKQESNNESTMGSQV